MYQRAWSWVRFKYSHARIDEKIDAIPRIVPQRRGYSSRDDEVNRARWLRPLSWERLLSRCLCTAAEIGIAAISIIPRFCHPASGVLRVVHHRRVCWFPRETKSYGEKRDRLKGRHCRDEDEKETKKRKGENEAKQRSPKTLRKRGLKKRQRVALHREVERAKDDTRRA